MLTLRTHVEISDSLVIPLGPANSLKFHEKALVIASVFTIFRWYFLHFRCSDTTAGRG